jgi:crotonobetainyl-CoA:carnitine CoA-transferase CaiB-like acyl-CoA transferase
MSIVLKGIKVLELCQVMQGPLAGQFLGDFGAEVIKIESPPAGDLHRHTDGIATDQNRMGSFFASLNRNKRSVCLDLKTEKGHADLIALVKGADVIINNYRPGVMEKLRLGYDDLKSINPQLVYAAATGFGESGPYAQAMGQDILMQSLSGLAWKTTADAAEPTFVNVAVADFASGILLAQGIVLALFERNQSGLGQKVNVNLFATMIAMQCQEAASLLNFNHETLWFDRAPNFTAQASDGWLTVLGFFRPNPLQLICKALGVPDLSVEMDLPDRRSQAARRKEIAARLRPEFATLTVADAVEKLQKVGVLAAPVLTLDEALHHPQTSANHSIEVVPVKGQEPMQVIANPITLSRSPATTRRGPPNFGEHDGEVLGDSVAW